MAEYDRPDVFLSHAGEDKPFAIDLSHDLGEGGLNLRVFLDKQSLKPGVAADHKMLSSIENSAVGLLLLNGTFLGKEWPMRELRRIMEQQKSLPVLYNTTYDDFAKLLKEQGEADAEMLQQLRRTTMVQHLSPGEPVLFRQNVCFAVLRRLATVCCPLVGRTPGDVFFVERVRDAVKHICSDDYFMELRVKDKREAKEWLQSLNVQLKRIEEETQAPGKVPTEVGIADRHKNADALGKEYSEQGITGHMKMLEQLRNKWGDAWPEGLLLSMSAHGGDVEAAQAAMRELWTFWRKVQRMYKTHDLLWPGDDPNFPMGFFSKVWAGRGREYRHLVEPLDIANWYFKNKQVESGHYADFDNGHTLDELSTQDNNKRPGRYILLQEMEKRAFGEAQVKTSLDKAFMLKKRLGERRWQDVLTEEQNATARHSGFDNDPDPGVGC